MSQKTPEQRYSATVADRVREGRGRGTGIGYLPWLTVRTRGLNSSTWRPLGKTGRVHHLLSDGEMALFALLDRSAAVIDIREQFPLLPLEETRSIAAGLGVRHPRANPFRDRNGPKVDVVMTTDLLLDLADEPEMPSHLAVSFKRAVDIDALTPIKLRNLLNKAEIERRYWRTRRIPFLLITDADVPGTVLRNMDLLHRFVSLAGVELPTSLDDLAQHLLDSITAAPDIPVRDHGAAFDAAMGLRKGTGVNIAWHCIATGRWSVDQTALLDPARPLVGAAPSSGLPEARP